MQKNLNVGYCCIGQEKIVLFKTTTEPNISGCEERTKRNFDKY